MHEQSEGPTCLSFLVTHIFLFGFKIVNLTFKMAKGDIESSNNI